MVKLEKFMLYVFYCNKKRNAKTVISSGPYRNKLQTTTGLQVTVCSVL